MGSIYDLKLYILTLRISSMFLDITHDSMSVTRQLIRCKYTGGREYASDCLRLVQNFLMFGGSMLRNA